MQKEKDIDLLTMSLDYPELNMVKYDGMSQVVIFELALRKVEKELQKKFLTNLNKCLELYYKLNEVKPNLAKTAIKVNGDVVFIKLNRDITTIDKKKLKLFIYLARHYLGDYLIIDDFQLGASINKNMLRKNLIDYLGKETNRNSSYLVYRQHGKVIVHNK